MTWAEKQIDVSLVEGFGGTLLTDIVSGAFDATEITPERVESSKSLVEDLFFDPRVGNLSDLALSYGGQTAFLDAVADDAELQKHVDRILAYAFIQVYAWDQRNTDADTFSNTSQKFENRLHSAIRAFSQIARPTLEAPEEPDVRTTPSSSATQTKVRLR